jgi:NodT family efflux transporter outer membrane factor (OMF) lipoprotein
MMRRSIRLFLPLSLLMLGLSGCLVGPNYVRPDVPVPDHYADQPAAAEDKAAAEALARWWHTFGDETLCKLIDDAVASNLDLQIAEARVREARATVDLTWSAYFPWLDSSASFTRSKTSENRPQGGSSGSSDNGGASGQTTNRFHAGFDASWELDIFSSGRALESANASLEAQTEAQHGTLVSLLSEVAVNYISLRGLQAELAILQKNVKGEAETLDLQRTKLEAGLASDLTVAQAEAQLRSIESQIPTIQTQITAAIHRLSILLGKEPEALSDELRPTGPLPVGPKDIPPGLPSELLRQRPDIRQAERELAAATANVGVAVADMFPKFQLTGSFGLESARLSDFTDAGSRFWSFGPALTLPIFEGGRITANIHIQEARQQQALLHYRQVVLQAFEEVENALTAYAHEQQRRDVLRQSVESNRRAAELALQLNDAGLVDFLNVLTAQQALYSAEDNLARSEQTVSTNLVALYKALGGGWNDIELDAGN